MRQTCYTRLVGEYVSPKLAASYFTPSDMPMVLAHALLVSLAQDLGRALAEGRWKSDPAEMRDLPNMTAEDLKLCRELDSSAVQTLYGVVAAGSAGRVPTGRGTVLRMARRYAATMKKWQRTRSLGKEAA
jgi:hypothetical protein